MLNRPTTMEGVLLGDCVGHIELIDPSGCIHLDMPETPLDVTLAINHYTVPAYATELFALSDLLDTVKDRFRIDICFHRISRINRKKCRPPYAQCMLSLSRLMAKLLQRGSAVDFGYGPLMSIVNPNAPCRTFGQPVRDWAVAQELLWENVELSSR
ncbi:hypothetical protein PTT_16718 [Pyrenophora teres f. teres 0-1]|uniref:Uncharacterized protein n=1 Tax=Pyrenophora teres f. teres (strain 0-1) TaxID=861557 RepID=E3S2W7_PYRTT|nr:hypothetical protein PTT_16718 [Pyrenophora teres f. teres 0-1]